MMRWSRYRKGRGGNTKAGFTVSALRSDSQYTASSRFLFERISNHTETSLIAEHSGFGTLILGP